jgi:hypothetical protein
MRRVLMTALATAAIGLGTAPAYAATFVDCGGGSACVSDTDNVLLDAAQDVSSGTGHISGTSTVIQFSTTDTDGIDLNPGAGAGQATITSGDGTLINNLTWQLLGGVGFTSAEFNLEPLTGGGPPVSPFDILVTSITNGVVTTATFEGDTGSNRFGVFASAGEILTGVTIVSDTGFGTFRQLRVTAGSGVPEPATWAMMLLGFGGIGMAMRRSRKRKPALMQIA